MIEFTTLQEETNKRYLERYKQHGVSSLSLGWSNLVHQYVRYQTVCDSIALKGKKILDFGCGFGDLLGYLQHNNIACEYIGVDINQVFIEQARSRYPKQRFEVYNCGKPIPNAWQSDIIIALGLLNYKQTKVENSAYAKWLLSELYKTAKQAVVCDFLSIIHDTSLSLIHI